MARRTTKSAKTTNLTAKAKAAKPTRSTAEVGGYEHVPITDLDVVLLEMNDNGTVNVQDVVFNVFESESKRWREGAAWLAFQRSDMPHHRGLSTWIGITKSVPLAVIDMIQRVLQAAGMEVERDTGRAVYLNLNPFARLSEDGLEILVPAALVGDPKARRVIDRGGVKVIARGYTVAPSKAAALNALFFGSDD